MMRWPSAYLCHLTNKARHTIYGAEVAQQVAAAIGAQGRTEGEREQGGESADPQAGPHPLLQAPPWSFSHEPYIPRPIISLHLRQGDKAREMNLFSLQSCMWLAYRIRRLVPAASHIWLSTEMQARTPSLPAPPSDMLACMPASDPFLDSLFHSLQHYVFAHAAAS